MLIRTISAFCIISSIFGQKPFGKISLPLGRVQVQSNGDWSRAKPNQPVFEGNSIRTQAKSRCEITLKGGGKVRIGENAELKLNEADVKPMVKNFNANLKKGSVWVSAKAAFGEKKNVAVRTPTAVDAIRGTVFKAKAGDSESSVQVYDGNVDVNQTKNFLEESWLLHLFIGRLFSMDFGWKLGGGHPLRRVLRTIGRLFLIDFGWK